MSRLSVLTIALLGTLPLAAQQKEGKVIYQRVMELNFSVRGNAELSNVLPKTRTNTFELNFSGNTVSWKQVQELQSEETGGPGIVLQFAGTDDLVWFDLTN